MSLPVPTYSSPGTRWEIDPQDTARLIRSRAKELVAVLDRSIWELGEALSSIINGQLYLYGEKQYATFDDYAEAELGFSGRKGRFYAAIFQSFLACGLGPDEVNRIGSAKCRLLARVIDVDNKNDWLQVAETSSFRQLETAVKEKSGEAKAPGQVLGSINIPYYDGDTKATWDAARELASRMTGCESSSAALEAISQEFIGTYGEDGTNDQEVPSSAIADYEILKRFGWRCAIASCGKRLTLQVHHVEYRSRRPDLINDPANKIPTCADCHQQITDEEVELVNIRGKWALRKRYRDKFK